MKNVKAIATGTAVVAVITFQQLEIAAIHDDVQEIKAHIIQTKEKLPYTRAEEECLAKNVFYEAGVEPEIGKFAVAQVTLNRLREGTWGRDICKVVYSPSQFSWTLDPRKRNRQPHGELWDESRWVARAVLAHGYRVKHLEDSTYYHADYIKQPVWARGVAKIQQIGQHIFYKKA